jgi:hypothetical protein
MLKKEIEIGGVYSLRWHDGSFTEVEILGTRRHQNYGSRTLRPSPVTTRYTARNLKTGRIVTIKSAAKLRERVR